MTKDPPTLFECDQGVIRPKETVGGQQVKAGPHKASNKIEVHSRRYSV